MNLLTRIFTRSAPPSDLPTRSPATGLFMPSPRTVERNSRRTDKHLQLAVYRATTTHAQRVADYEQWRREHVPLTEEEAFQRAVKKWMFAGLSGRGA